MPDARPPTPERVYKTIFRAPRVSLDLAVTMPTFTFTPKGVYALVSPSAALSFSIAPTHVPVGFRPSVWIMQRSFNSFYATIDRVTEWFLSAEFEKLFLFNKEKQEVVFNAEMNQIRETFTDSKSTPTTMTIIPSIHLNQEQRACEGCSIYMNGDMGNMVTMSGQDILRLHGVLQRLDLEQEAVNLVELLQCALRLGNVSVAEKMSLQDKATAIINGTSTDYRQAQQQASSSLAGIQKAQSQKLFKLQ